MADILIRKVSDETKERLGEAAALAGSSLEAFLRQVLDERAAEVPRPNDDDQPFGTWAVALFAELNKKYPGIGDEYAEILESFDGSSAEDEIPILNDD